MNPDPDVSLDEGNLTFTINVADVKETSLSNILFPVRRLEGDTKSNQ